MNMINNTPFECTATPFIGIQNKTIMTVIVKGTFDFVSEDKVIPSKEQIQIFFGDERYESFNGLKFESDLIPFKPYADIALIGKVYSSKPVRSINASLQVDNMIKTIWAFGDRKWNSVTKSMTEPELFTEMEIVYEKAFGGSDESEIVRENMIGTGFVAIKSNKDIDQVTLPNIEDPENLIKSIDDHPSPAGFGFIEKSWHPRIDYIGTYDEKWQKEQCPGYPDDFSFRFYNAAHPDLQKDSYLNGDEKITLNHLTKDGFIRFYLPGIKLDCKVEKNTSDQNNINIPLLMDTLCLIPDEKRLYTVCRGHCEIQDMSMKEIKTIEINKR